MNLNGTTFRVSARRLAATAAATALAAGPAALATAGSAHATTGKGSASAVVLRTGLDVSLLNKTVEVPLTVSLNEAKATAADAPASAERTALTAELDGVDAGRPFSVAHADVASAKATVSADRAEAVTRLTNASIHLPGLPLLSLIEVEAVTSKAVCAAGERPTATANVLGAVTVLGKKVTLSATGPTDVKIPQIGEVRLDVSKTDTTSRTAAASALQLTVTVNPLKLNVAEVTGTVTLASATCETPATTVAAVESDPAATPATPSAAAAVTPQTDSTTPEAKTNLAETGGSSATPYVVGGAVALLVVGGGAVGVARRRSAGAGAGA
ncbi:LPXTG-motif cell wall anchor domain protein [Actinobacteria bacterium OK074]|nr:LPXTG-motif cell wall anchor domain protein [Actinobacteria bacterium OK074]